LVQRALATPAKMPAAMQSVQDLMFLLSCVKMSVLVQT
jgi:hypothetical protein